MKERPFTKCTTFLAYCLLLASSYGLLGMVEQDTSIQLEAEKGLFNKPLPHGKSFAVESTLPKTFDKAELHWWLEPEKECNEPKDSSFAAGVIEPKLDKNLRHKVKFQVEPLAYSASYCFSLHVYQEWSDKDRDALEESVFRILKDSLKSKEVFPHRVIRKDLGPLASYWVNSEGKTLQLHTVEWFDQTREYLVLRTEARAYLRNYHITQLAIQRKREALSFFRQNNQGALDRDFAALENALVNLFQTTNKLPHGFDPKETKLEEDFIEAEGKAATFEQFVERRLFHKDCNNGAYNEFCHLLSELRKNSQIFKTGFKNLTEAFKRMKHAWSALEVKLEVFSEETNKLLKNPIYLSGEGHVNADTPQGKRHISFSFGALTAFGVYGEDMLKLKDMDLLLYTTMNFYFSPVDTTIPLAIDGGFSRRFSVNIGMTLTEIYDPKSEVRGVVMDRGLVTGVGYRISDNLKVSLGLLWYKKVPVRGGPSDDKRLAMSPYIGVAIDLDLLRLFFKEAKETKDATN